MAFPLTRRAMLALSGCAVVFALPGMAQNAPFLSGRVIWSSGVATQGMAVRLVRSGSAVASTFSDANGYYAFRDIPGQPRDYTVEISDAGGVIASIPVGDLLAGSVLPPITLR